MGQSAENDQASPDRVIESQLEWMAWAVAVHLAEKHRIVASIEALVESFRVAKIPEILEAMPPVPPRPDEVEVRRYSVRANPQAAAGAMETVSFRVPLRVKELFLERVRELAVQPNSPIQNQTDAGQDALVKWLIMEGK